jgi:hypothetical protein
MLVDVIKEKKMSQGLIEAIANAIASAEGFFVGGALPNRNNNPGDLRAAPWLQHPVVAGGFWQASTVAEGIAGLLHQIALDVARGYSLQRLIYAWAPPTDGNNTANYLTETVRRLAAQGFTIDPTTPLQEYLVVENVP